MHQYGIDEVLVNSIGERIHIIGYENVDSYNIAIIDKDGNYSQLYDVTEVELANLIR